MLPLSGGKDLQFQISRSYKVLQLCDCVSTLEIVKAGLHCSLRMSRHMLPLLLIFGWNTFVLKDTYNRDSSMTVNRNRRKHFTKRIKPKSLSLSKINLKFTVKNIENNRKKGININIMKINEMLKSKDNRNRSVSWP